MISGMSVDAAWSRYDGIYGALGTYDHDEWLLRLANARADVEAAIRAPLEAELADALKFKDRYMGAVVRMLDREPAAEEQLEVVTAEMDMLRDALTKTRDHIEAGGAVNEVFIYQAANLALPPSVCEQCGAFRPFHETDCPGWAPVPTIEERQG